MLKHFFDNMTMYVVPALGIKKWPIVIIFEPKWTQIFWLKNDNSLLAFSEKCLIVKLIIETSYRFQFQLFTLRSSFKGMTIQQQSVWENLTRQDMSDENDLSK